MGGGRFVDAAGGEDSGTEVAVETTGVFVGVGVCVGTGVLVAGRGVRVAAVPQAANSMSNIAANVAALALNPSLPCIFFSRFKSPPPGAVISR